MAELVDEELKHEGGDISSEEEDCSDDGFDGGMMLKESMDAADGGNLFDLDKLRNQNSAAFNIMAEHFDDDEMDAPLNEEPHPDLVKPEGKPELSAENQLKRMSIRMSVRMSVTTAHRRCTFVRESGTLSSKFYPNYHLYLDDNNSLLLAARKLTRNRTASYYIYDMSIEKDVMKMKKDSPQLVGRVEKRSFDHTELALCREFDEFAGVIFHRSNPVEDFFQGSHPRHMTCMIPKQDEIGNTQPHDVSQPGAKTLTDYILTDDKNHDHFVLKTKEPVFYNGCYRLHFLGKVPVIPSVKNFQLTPANDPTQILVQFCKISEDKYRLDYEPPVTAAQAFMFALVQFSKL